MNTTWDFIEKYYVKHDRSSILKETSDLIKIIDGKTVEGDDAWIKLEKIKKQISDNSIEVLTYSQLEEFALEKIHNLTNDNLSSLLNAAITNFHKVNPEYQKEIAIVTAFFVSEIETNKSLFDIVEKAYQLAIQFVNKYPPKTVWEMDTDLDYEETLSKFLREHEKN